MPRKPTSVDVPTEDPTNRLALLPALAYGAGIAALLAYVVFFSVYKRMPLGGPESWAQFGDYFGGVVNSVAGIVAVFLVYFTLKVTRREASDTREKMQQQLNVLADQQRLTDLHRRLEGVMEEWGLLIERRLFVGKVDDRPSGDWLSKKWRLLFDDPSVYHAARASRRNVAAGTVRSDWQEEFKDAIQMLAEIQIYCSSYDEIARNRDLTDFYRRRLSSAVRLLFTLGLVTNELEQKLFVPPIPLAEADSAMAD